MPLFGTSRAPDSPQVAVEMHDMLSAPPEEGAVDGAATGPTSPFEDSWAAGAAVIRIPLSEINEELRRDPGRVGDSAAAVALEMSVTAEAAHADAVERQSNLSPAERTLAEEVEGTLRDIVFGADSHARSAAVSAAPPQLRELAQEMANDINNLEAEMQRDGGPPLGERARQLQAMETAGRWSNPFRNEGTSTPSRLLGNLVSAGMRAGVSTLISTFARNMAAFALQQTVNAARATAAVNGTATNATAAPTTTATTAAGGAQPWSTDSAETLLNAVGAASVGVMVVMQLAGGIRDHRNGQGTLASNALRAGATGLALSALATAANKGAWGFPMAAFATTVATYSLTRGPIAAALPYQDNLVALPGATLAAATVSYSAAQAAGNFAQNAAGWNAGATSAPRTETAAQILNTPQPWANNVGHSALNAGLEIFDDLQFMATARALNHGSAQRALRELGPDGMAQMRAAALQGMLRAAAHNPDISTAGLEAAATQAVRQHSNTQLEGLRLSMARAPVTDAQVQNCAAAAVQMLGELGYRFDPQAADGSPEDSNNRMMAAFVAQQLRSMEMRQPLEMFSQVSSADGWRRLGGRMTNQMLTVEPLRQAAFNYVFGSLVNMSRSVSDDTPHAGHINNAIESALLGGTIGVVYPVFYGAVITRGAPHGAAEAAANRQGRIDAIIAGGADSASGASADNAPANDGAADTSSNADDRTMRETQV